MGNWTEAVWPILVSAALKSTLVLGAAWLIAILLRGRSASARHIVWTACAAALLALPVLSIGLPAVHLPWANALLPADGDIVLFHTTATSSAATTSGIPAAGLQASAARTAQVPANAGAAMTWRSAVVLLWAAGLLAGDGADAGGMSGAPPNAARGAAFGIRRTGGHAGARPGNRRRGTRAGDAGRNADDIRGVAAHRAGAGVRGAME